MELHHHTILHQTSYLHNSRTKRSAVTRTGLVQYYIISHYTTKQPELIWFNSNPFLPSLYQVRDPEIKYHFRYLTLLAFSRLKSINQNSKWNRTVSEHKRELWSLNGISYSRTDLGWFYKLHPNPCNLTSSGSQEMIMWPLMCWMEHYLWRHHSLFGQDFQRKGTRVTFYFNFKYNQCQPNEFIISMFHNEQFH